ncbi:unnamed protein product [Schistosoma mattheei]|uniref:Uncharacterized protein n=1 Tax=Schistosoma mattheei TaxID=31246 RepID=A0A183NM96_9TREM|nr:unnamed protein product [Schistosoma mattheei]
MTLVHYYLLIFSFRVNLYVQGGLCALISGVICGLWICIGNTFITSRTNNGRLPLTIENCSSKILQNISSSIVTATMNTSTTIETTTWSFYSLSYLYYATACLIVGIPVGFIISAITGFNSRSQVNPRLLAWQARSFYRHFPNWLPPQTANDQVGFNFILLIQLFNKIDRFRIKIDSKHRFKFLTNYM